MKIDDNYGAFDTIHTTIAVPINEIACLNYIPESFKTDVINNLDLPTFKELTVDTKYKKTTDWVL